MPMTTRSFRPDDRARLQECEAALQRLRKQMKDISHALNDGFAVVQQAEAALKRASIYVQGAEEILGNTLGDEPNP